MKCIFILDDLVINDRISIQDKELIHHLHHVLRLRIDEELELKDSKQAYLGKLIGVTKREMTFLVLSKRNLKAPNLKITLCQGLIKGDPWHFLLQKATELGVSKIIPFKSKYSIIQIPPKDQESKITRWQKICEEASKQCGRDYTPLVTPIIQHLNELPSISNNGLIAYEMEKQISFKQTLTQINPNHEIFLLLGPEGGFTDLEVKTAKELDFRSCSISDNILRSETATISMISNIIFNFTDS